ncbi:MAG: hypothetical protein ACE5GG_06105, partial [Candidatus Omnitrophota bacterium]
MWIEKKVIRRYYHKLGMKENFSFIDDADAAQAVGMLIDKSGAKRSPGRFPRVENIRQMQAQGVARDKIG